MANHNVLDTSYDELEALEWEEQISTLFAMFEAPLAKER